MNPKPRVGVHWFRRDLRLHDNHALYQALSREDAVLPLFIFDSNILDKLEDRTDRRVDFIHRTLSGLREELTKYGSSVLVEHGRPEEVWPRILQRYEVSAVFANHDHEPYAITRDQVIAVLLAQHGIPLLTFKDISIFERDEVVKDDGRPYTVFTPYARKWRSHFSEELVKAFASEAGLNRLHRTPPLEFPDLNALGFSSTDLEVPPLVLADETLRNYDVMRNVPGVNATSRMSTHLRFGTVSVRDLVRRSMELSPVYLNELIWREFFMQILWHFPHPERAFKPAYDQIPWRSDAKDFDAWCHGRTGYPLVDAGMRELLATGLMHNRVRMVVASFLTKHLLIDWRWGEAWFAEKLLDFELSSNNGGWQWASGSGCDAAPYFRVFNPRLQQERFDPQLKYVKHWLPGFNAANYMRPMVVHEAARDRALMVYKQALSEKANVNDKQTQLF
jgi:deoxyribodipyrimidine photo-lyase